MFHSPTCQVLSTIGRKYSAHAGQQYRYCGSELPPPLTSDTNEMLITLKTDGSVSHRGFRARWTTEELPRELRREYSNCTLRFGIQEIPIYVIPFLLQNAEECCPRAAA